MQTAVALADLLAEEVREVGAFIELLQQEQKLLSAAGNADALMPLVEQKTALAVRLRQISDQRERLLAARNFKPGREGMEAFLATLPTGTIHDHWQQLRELAKEARALNETNGTLITIHWKHNQQALAALMSAADSAMVYGPGGQQSGGSGSRLLGSA